MKQALLFQNPGNLDLRFIELMGVSVKESSNPIGLFGTGLKYAIATIIRFGGEISIFTENKWFEFQTEKFTLRDKEFERIVIIDVASQERTPLSITTELGKKWLPWMAIRELYSNTLDEGGSTHLHQYHGDLIFNHLVGSTSIVVQGDAFIDVWKNAHKYFIQRDETPLYAEKEVDIYAGHPGESTGIFYKGIRVKERVNSKYRYNIKSDLSLTEDRTALYDFQIDEAIERSLVTSKNADFIDALLLPDEASMESQLNFTFTGDIQPSPIFVARCNKLAVQGARNFNKSAFKWLQRRMLAAEQLEKVELTDVQKAQLNRAIACLHAIGFQKDLANYEIEVVRWLGQGILGTIRNGKIILSKECFVLGTKYVTSTLLEEFVHLHYGHADHSRELQTWLFDRVVHMIEEHVIKEPI